MRYLLGLTLLAGCHSLTRPVTPEATGHTPQAPIGMTIRWRIPLHDRGFMAYKPQEFARAATDGHRVYVGSREGVFYGINAADGRTVWSTTLSGGIDGQATYDDTTALVYVGADDGTFYAMDAASGAVRWTHKAKGAIDIAPTLAGSKLYYTSSEGRLYCLDALTGKWQWQYEREPPESFTIHGFAGVLVTGDRVYTGFADGYVVALKAASGDVVWARSLAAASDQFVDVDTTPVLADGTLYAASYSGGMYALNPKDGTVRWRFDVEGAAGIAVANRRVYFTAAKTGLHVLDTAGRVIWRQAMAQAGDLSPPRLSGPYVFLSGSDAGLFVVDRRQGELAAFFNPGDGISAQPMVAGTSVYVLSNGGFFYKLVLE
jgi:outer membrane protein assembly factor BamB